MKPKHTPGPWKIHDKQQVFDQLAIGPNEFFSAAKALGFDKPEMIANANLIAVAPEMYAEIDMLIRGYHNYMRAELKKTDDASREQLDVFIGRLEFVLAKVRGES